MEKNSFMLTRNLEKVSIRKFSFLIDNEKNEVEFFIDGEKKSEFLILIEGARISFITNKYTFSCPLETYLEDKAYTLQEAVFQTIFR